MEMQGCRYRGFWKFSFWGILVAKHGQRTILTEIVALQAQGLTFDEFIMERSGTTMGETWEVAIPDRNYCFYVYSPEGRKMIKREDKKGQDMASIFIGLLAEGWEPLGQGPDNFYPMLRRQCSKTTGPTLP